MTQREEFEAWFHKYDDNNFMIAEDQRRPTKMHETSLGYFKRKS